MNAVPRLLFSIDLEPFYPAHDCDSKSTPLPELVDKYLAVLDASRSRATFFVVGDVARSSPELLRRIHAAGHELGCHGDHHHTLDRFTPESFAADLRANRTAVEEAINGRVVGFRAPLLSLTEKSRWAHRILAEEGFTYSSSVLAAPNPLFGWPGFPPQAHVVDGVCEIPVTLSPVPTIGRVPLFCGTYFRVFPWWMVKRGIKAQLPDSTITSYFHPYDIDHRQRWTMHAGVRGSRLMNVLLFVRRKSLLRRIKCLLQSCPSPETYREYASRVPFQQ